MEVSTLRGAPLEGPRAGAIAGTLFSLISLVLTRMSIPANPQAAGTWLSAGCTTVNLALSLLPFAAIAILWFIGELRDRMGARKYHFFGAAEFRHPSFWTPRVLPMCVVRISEGIDVTELEPWTCSLGPVDGEGHSCSPTFSTARG